MALTDYKHPRIIKENNGEVTVLARIYEGAITTEKEENEEGQLVDVTRYRRTSKLKEITKVISSSPTKAGIDNELNIELAKDVTRTPIDEQKIG